MIHRYVEDAVKRRYNMFVTALEECSRDNLEFLKEKATKVWDRWMNVYHDSET